MELKKPKRKHRVRISLQQPFPILNRDVTAIPTNKVLWQVYTGKYSGDFVMVDAPDEIAALHNMGFFGKGSLSRAALEFGKQKQGVPPIIRQRQWERREQWADKQKKIIDEYTKTQKMTMMKDKSEVPGTSDCPQKTVTSDEKESCTRREVSDEIIVDSTVQTEKDEEINVEIIMEDEVPNANKPLETNDEKCVSITAGRDVESTKDVTVERKEEMVDLTGRNGVQEDGIEKVSGVTENDDKKEANGSEENVEEIHIDVGTEKKEENAEVNVTIIKDIDCIVEKDEEMNVDIITVDTDDVSKTAYSVKNNDDDVIMLDSAEEEDNGSKVNTNACTSTVSHNDKGQNGNETRERNNDSKGVKRKDCIDLEADHDKSEQNVSSVEVDAKNMVLVLPDSDDDEEGYLTNINPRLEKRPFPIHESLHLTLEESFFLSFGLGCLQVIDLFGNVLSLDGMWQLFCKSQKDFVQKYVTYHYFRSKGWVVKPGIKFGGDFLLYKQGPPFYHASYIVIMEVIDGASLSRLPSMRHSLSWKKLIGLNRLAESSGKEVLLSQVMWPSEANHEELQYPSVLSRFRVNEVLIRRWISSQEREESDTQ